jgi:hypothetical protein
MEQDKWVIFDTGIPSTGKSEIARELVTGLQRENIPTTFLDDYPTLYDWAVLHREDRSLVEWYDDTTNFSVVAEAYPEASAHIARVMAEQAKVLLEGFVQVVILESARGAAVDGHRDEYGAHLFRPFVEVLGGVARFANIEVTVRDPQIALERAQKRLDEAKARQDPKLPAPPFVVRKYVSPTVGVQSSTKQAERFGSDFAFNMAIDNTKQATSHSKQVEGIIAQLMGR